MNQSEALERIRAGDIPEQTFYNSETRIGYQCSDKYLFADGAVLTTSLASLLVARKKVVLVVDGDKRRVFRKPVEADQ